MCGIAGIVVRRSGGEYPHRIRQMTDALRHRGPDGEGFIYAPGRSEGAAYGPAESDYQPRTCRVALGHRRLAIIDLHDRGLQPLQCRGRDVWIVFNGEIYNYRSIREELEERGLQFRTQTDTEVLLASYLTWGVDCLSHLQGMFAFAIWDGEQRRLFCARDRLGIKPFYYHAGPDLLLFASEAKSVLASGLVSARANSDAIYSYLRTGNCDAGAETLFSDIHSLPGGYYLIWDEPSNQLKTEPYWQVSPAAERWESEESAVERLRTLLLGVMDRHLISDVRVGSCLSGGVDSSAVVGYAAELRKRQAETARSLGNEFLTFTSCFDNLKFDERTHAIEMAQYAGATPELVFPEARAFWSEFQRMAWHQDFPFGTASIFAQWCVMRAAAQAGVKVLLDGQGGDESFAGYAKFRYALLLADLRRGALASALKRGVSILAQGDSYVLDIRKGWRYLPASLRRLLRTEPLIARALRQASHFKADTISVAGDIWQSTAGNAANGSLTALQRFQMNDLSRDTLPQLLRYEDRNSMAFSIEARVPLLDHKLVEFALGLPDDYKVRGGWGKWILRKAMTNFAPESICWRKSKLGFVAPTRDWLGRDLRGQVTDYLHSDLRCGAFIKADVVREWYDSSAGKQVNESAYLGLFRILCLETWMRAFDVQVDQGAESAAKPQVAGLLN